MGRAIRHHSATFKVEAVRLMQVRLADGLTLERVSRELDVGPDLLRLWAKQVAGAPAGAMPEEIFPGVGRRRRFAPVATLPRGPAGPAEASEPPDVELARLRRENARLRQERDFLKKAAAFFAKESP